MRRINVKFFVILLCALVALAGVTIAVHRLQASNISHALLFQVDQAEAEGRGDQAARFLGRYLEFEPQDLEQRARLGALLSEPKMLATPKGQKRAKFVLEQVLTRSPDHHASRLALVKVALQGRWEELAKDHLTYLETALPDSADVIELKAQWQELKGMEAPASESYRRAIALAPERVGNYVRLVYVLRRLEPGKPRAHSAEMDNLVKKAMELKSEDAGVLLIAAERALDRDAVEEASALLKRGQDLYPKALKFYTSLAGIEEKAGRHDAALVILEKGLTNLPKAAHFELHWAQANLHLDAGDLEQARAAAERLADFPNSETARVYLQARMSMQQNLWFEAARAFERLEPALKSSRDLALQSALYLGICYEQLHEPAKQLTAYRKVVELDPLSPVGRRGVAMAHWALGAGDAAIQALRENVTLARDPRRPARHRVELLRLMVLAELKKPTRTWTAIERELEVADKEAADSLDVLLLHAEVLHHQGKTEQARTLISEAQGRHGKTAELWLMLATLWQNAGNAAEAELALAAAPDDVEVRMARARLWSQGETANFDKLKSLESGLEKFNTDDQARLLYSLGTAHFQTGKADDAQRLWWRITTLPRHGDNVRVRFLLLDLALQQNDAPAMRRVLEDLKKVESGPKTSAGTNYKLALAMTHIWEARRGEKDKAQTAKKLLMEVEGERPYWDAAALARAEANEILGNVDQAVGNYRKAMELGMRGKDITRKLALLLSQSHRFDEAEKEIAKLQKEAPLGDDIQRLAVAISMQRDDYSKAEQLIRQSMTGKKNWRDHLWLGQVLAGEGRTEEAEKELRAAVALEKKQPEAYIALVRLKVRAGKAEDADSVLAEIQTHVPVAQRDTTLAQCHEILGQFDKAEAHLFQALKVEPENAVLHKMHAAFLIRTGRVPDAEPILRHLAKSTNSEDAAWARRNLSLVLVAGGNVKNAAEALQVVGVTLDAAGAILEEKETDSPEDLLARAKVLALQQRKTLRTRAIALLEGLQKKNALAPEDQFLLAQLYTNQGTEPVWWGKARDLLIGLVKSYPRQPQYLFMFAQQSLRHKDLGDAERMTTKLEQVEKARGLSSGELGSVELRARIYEASGNGKKAVQILQDYANQAGAPPERVFFVASMQARLGNLKDAIDTCLASKAAPDAQARTIMGILRRFHGSSHFARSQPEWNQQVEAVETTMRKQIAANPTTLVLRLHLADLQDLLGRYDMVETLCREVLERDPNSLPALNNLAWMLAQRKTRPEEALKLVNHAIEVHGLRPELLDTRAVVYLTLGRSEPALADLERATRDAPTAAKYFNLARAHHLMRDSKSALAALNQATALGLDDKNLHPTEREVYRRVTAELKGR